MDIPTTPGVIRFNLQQVKSNTSLHPKRGRELRRENKNTIFEDKTRYLWLIPP